MIIPKKWKVRLATEFRRAIGAHLGVLLKSWWGVFFLLLFFALLALAGSWIADGLTFLIFDKRYVDGTIMLLVSFTILLVLGVAIKKAVKDTNFEIVEEEDPEGKKVLILFLSPEFDAESILKDITTLEELNKALAGDSQSKSYKWLMPLASIRLHAMKGNLDCVYVITSPETDEQYRYFEKLVSQVFKSFNFRLRKCSISDSESVKEMYETLEKLFGILTNKGINGKKYKEKDIVIDVTGGKKTATIAGVLASVYHFTEVQYVSTTDKRVKAYYVEPVS